MSERQRLPERRYCETFKIHMWGDTFHITLGHHRDGRVGEVFIAGSKSGVQLDAVCRDGAVLLSLAMQYGVPLDVIREALTRDHDGSPSTIVGAIVDRLAPRESEPLKLISSDDGGPRND